MNIIQTDIERFWQKINFPNDHINECWEWTACIHKVKGYGRFGVDGRIVDSHVFSYIIHFGDRNGLYVLHKCNNRSCVNPNHLYLGTQLDNMKDRRNANHYYSQVGSKNPNSKLNEDKVKEMLTKIWNNEFATIKEVANYYGVSRECIYPILSGRKWTQITSQLVIPLQQIRMKI